ncbi:DHS-like NAD/FAD-binding domain-containing protein, partial [Leptodontidium sp. 2 PMI_412]
MPTTRVGPDSDPELQEVADVMGNSRKVVVVTGAGISTNCGIPDFRSENGLYSLIQAHLNRFPTLPNLKGRDLFDSMVWQDAFTTSIFYMFISSLRQKVKNVASTTESHKFLRILRDGGRLVRNYSQNIDLLEEREGLCTDLSKGTGSKGRFSRRGGGCESVTLHGSLERLRCSICNTKSDWDGEGRIATTLAGSAPDCPTCQTQSNKRAGNGRRKLAVGRLRPDIVLYGEEHPNANLIAPLVTHDLALGPDVLLIMGTSLKVHGLKIMVKEFAKAVHSKGGKVVFVNNTKPSESTWGDVIDYWVQWDCDQWVLDLKDRREDLWL